MAELNITELDFEEIKNNLRTYLAAQPEFTDYDFTGSALNTLLDVLAYNTHYNALLANFQANEMFLDSAIKRGSIISLAKSLGYTPRSVTSAKANVDITVTKNVTVGSTLSLLKSMKFSTTTNNVTYIFNVNTTKTVTETSGEFIFQDIELIEGNRLSNTFTITADTVSGPLIIPIENVDVSTIEIYVQNSIGDLTSYAYNKVDTVVDVTPTSKVFWVEEGVDGYYKILFGDDIIGKQLVAGNIVTVSYLASKGSAPNGAQNFIIVGTIAGETQVQVTTNTAAAGGTEKETVASIKFNAPKFNASRNRAVTAKDYQTLVKNSLSKIREVAVWGGEDNDPPMYGKVFLSINPVTGAVITEADKEYIRETVLRPKSVLSVQHEFVDPDYMYIGIEGVVNYDSRLTTLTPNAFATIATSSIQDYFNEEFGILNKTFFLSSLNDRMKTLSSAVVGSVFKMRLQKRLNFVSGTVGHSQTLNFLTAIDPETIRSSTFVSIVGNAQYNAYLQDYSNEAVQNDVGEGVINLVNSFNDEIITQVGTVNYQTGIVQLSNVVVTSYLGNLDKLYISARPQPLYQNVTSRPVRIIESSPYAIIPEPSKNTILVLDDSTSNGSANVTPGLSITCVPFVE